MRKTTNLFPRLELLESFNSFDVPSPDFDSTLLIGVQHLNQTTGSMVEKMISIGLKPQNIYLLGKCYSSNSESLKNLEALGCYVKSTTYSSEPGYFTKANAKFLNDLWDKILSTIEPTKINKIIILDDGGRLISTIPESLSSAKIVCIEQTTKGIRNKNVYDSKYPVISVAQSFSKISFESQVIASAVIFQIESFLTRDIRIGVVGLGNIGKALLSKLTNMGYKVSAFDIKLNDSTLENVIKESDIIFGCTGYSLDLKKEWFENKTKILASCSSEDIEFNQIFNFNLTYSIKENASKAPHVIYQSNNSTFMLLNSGFPINFDNSKEIEEIKDIQITRGLIFSAFLQALSDSTLKTGLNPLSFLYEERIQNFIKNSHLDKKAEAI